MEKVRVNESENICCQKRKEALNKISSQGTSIIESVSE